MEVDGFPPGFLFLPTHQQCIHYLTLKFTSQPLPFGGGLFLDLDPYNIKQLPHIFSSALKKGEVYTFTKLHKKGKTGNTNANRRVGKGTWHGDRTVKITNDNDDDDGPTIGMYHKFSYREKGSEHDHQFLMTEYTLSNGTCLQYDPLNDFVLCHIVKKGRGHNGKKVCKPKRTRNHQAAAVFEHPEPIVATANPSYAGVENHQVGVVFQQTAPIAADVSFYAMENPSTSSCHSSEVETPTYFQPFGNDTLFSATLEDEDNLLESLLSFDYESECPSMDSCFFLEGRLAGQSFADCKIPTI